MFSDSAIFPKGRVTLTVVDGTQREIFPTGSRVKISHIIVGNEGSVTGNFTFREIADTPVIAVVGLPASDTVVLPGWETTTGGLEVARTNGTATATVTVFYYKPVA